MKTAVICVTGRIQEVGYRTRVIGLAHVLDITGYVRNLPDGNVEIVAQASEEVLEDFIEKIKLHDDMIRVDGVKVDYFDQYQGFTDFHKVVSANETDSRLDKAVIELKNIASAIKEGNQEIISTIKEGNQELKQEIGSLRDDVHGIGVKMDNNHAELVGEVRKGNKALTSEMRDDIKAIKAHLKIP